MKTNERQAARQQYFLNAGTILKYLLGTSEGIDTMITCRNSSVDLRTTDYELYQAFGSLEKYDDVPRARIAKLLENVDVSSHRKETGHEKSILTHERVEVLRKIAVKNQGDDKNE